MKSPRVRPAVQKEMSRTSRLIAVVVVIAPLAILARQESSNYVDAETIYRATVARHPDSWLAHTNLAVIELQRSPAQGIARLRESLKYQPRFAETHYNLGRGLHELGRMDEAISSYQEAIRLKPGYVQAHDNLATAYAANGRLAEAEREYRAALVLKPRLAGAHTNLGIVLAMTGRLDESVSEHREAIRLAPELASAHVNLGNALFQLRRFAEASDAYRAALRVDPGLQDVRGLLARAEAAQGKE